MPRNISFMLTTPQFLDGSKDVTRRLGWLHLKFADILQGVEKSQGIKPGEKIKRLGLIKVADLRRERLGRMIDNPEYGKDECRHEGFPEMTPAQFVEFFCGSHKGCTPDTVVTRIQFVHINQDKK